VRVDEHTIDADGTPVFYRRAGETPILYLHGIPTSSDDWLPFLAATGGIAPDLIGFGRSGKAGNLDYSLSGYADFIEDLLGRLEIDDRVSLVAHGWGAGGALVFAQRRPERIERLVLLNPLPLFDGVSYGRLERILRTPAVGELAMGSVTKWLLARRLRRGTANPDAWSAKRIAAVWEQFDQGTQRAILRLLRSAGPDELRSHGADLGSIIAPALILWGELDPWFAPRFADAYQATLADGRRTRLAGAGHWPWLDDRTVVDTVARHLAER
jgi:pimeloyl-ACP methyl ester carboxylesterase